MFLTVSFLSLAFIALCLTINLVISMYQDYYKSKQIHKNRKSSNEIENQSIFEKQDTYSKTVFQDEVRPFWHTASKAADKTELSNEYEFSHKQSKNLLDGEISITPHSFFLLKNTLVDFTGVYILLNEANGKNYVGQSKSVIRRVNSHFTGHGNGDIYADYCRGDTFKIRLLSLTNSKYQSLDALERDMISLYDAYANGYNKTRGNQG